MSDASRRAYQRFATFFLVTGGTFLVLGILRATVLPDLLRGNPVPVALLLLAIGGGLRWTVRPRPGDEEPLEGPSPASDPAEGPSRVLPMPVEPAPEDERQG